MKVDWPNMFMCHFPVVISTKFALCFVSFLSLILKNKQINSAVLFHQSEEAWMKGNVHIII